MKESKKIKNAFLLKRGSYSMVITALVIVGIIIFNVMVSALADRFVLEFDMTPTKDNTITEENLDFIKGIKDEISVIVCATEDEYMGEYMAYYAMQQYSLSSDATPYHTQTVNLIKRYGDYNKNIKVEFMDTQTSEFTSITAKYPNSNLSYGDIIVSATVNNNERHKIIKYNDIYNIYEDNSSGYYTNAYISSNNIETALTSAIAYVLSTDTKKIGIITGHSASDVTADYVKLLEINNYETELIDDVMLTSISDEFDALVIAAPTTDFSGEELNLIATFLENDGNLDKGLIVFETAAAPYLPNLSDFLSEWGIGVDEGILYETDGNFHMPDDPTVFVTMPSTEDKATSTMTFCITSNNVPVKMLFEKQSDITVSPLMFTSESVVAAPKGTKAGWEGAGDYEKQMFYGALQAKKLSYNDDNEEIQSHVVVFSSIDFINSSFSENYPISNSELSLAVAERASTAESNGITFDSKTLTSETYTHLISETSAQTIKIIFMIALPIITLAFAVYVYIKRRNA